MYQFLALSFSIEVGASARDRIVRRGLTLGGDRAREVHSDRDTSVRFDSNAPYEVVVGWGIDENCDIVDRQGSFAAVLCKQPYTTAGQPVTGAWILAAAATGGSEFGALAPPFGGAYRQSLYAPVTLVTDVCGLRHVYIRQERHWAAASTSALLLAQLEPTPFDEEAILGFALAGNYDGTRTPFAGVRKVGNGGRAMLKDGIVRLDHYRTDDRHPPVGLDDDLVAKGAEILRGLVCSACLSHTGDLALELSGGFDSRGLLAALPPDLRRKTTMLTLGAPDQVDWQVAQALTAGTGLAHEFVDLRPMSALSPEQAWGRVLSSAARHDASSMAVATAVLGWVEERLPQGPRFNGINGEYARGRFYPGQRAGTTTPQRVERLARWRVFANDAVDPWLFTPGTIEEARASTVQRLKVEFAGYSTDWLRATDDHFLYGRMQRWCGIEFSASCTTRPMLAPYFCTPFLAWSRRLSEGQKRSSRLFAAVIEQLDPRVATIPLATSLTPRQAAHPTMSTQARQASQFARRVARKAKQRLNPGTDAPPVGAHTLGDLAAQHLRSSSATLEPLARFSWIDHDAVASIASGTRTPSTATVGFLANLITIGAALATSGDCDD